ncbi:MAG: recombinase family protein [Micropepsaceae bacterium]
MSKRIGYLRVSTFDQRPDRQIDGLKPHCDEMHIECVSAVKAKRPVYEKVLRRLEAGDVLVVWDLDRAFRSVVDALTEAEKLRSRGVVFRIVNLQVDTATPSGMLVYTVMSACAEFERRTLAQRTREGLAAARLRGAKLGRPAKLSSKQLKRIRQRHEANGETLTRIAQDYGVAPWTITRTLRRHEAAAVPPR